MSNVAWETAHSVEAKVSPAFAWSYMTNVTNWDDPPAKFALERPFIPGASGTTQMPGQEPMHWQIQNVSPTKMYTLEMALDQAALLFEWRFDGLLDGRTRLTQYIVLKGENADAYRAQVREAFSSNLAAGMTKIAAAMERAEARVPDAGGEAEHR